MRVVVRGMLIAFALLVSATSVACEDGAPRRAWRPSDHGQPEGVSTAPPPAQRPPVPAAEARLRAGAALFSAHCASCHGPTGRGDGPARSAAVQPTDLTRPEFQATRSDEALMTVIATGRGAMPGFADQLDERGLVVLVAYVRSLAAAPEAAPAPAPESAPETAPAAPPAEPPSH